MQMYCDKNLLFLKTLDQKTVIYSPYLHRMVKVDNRLAAIIRNKESKVIDIPHEVIEKLKKASILFNDKHEYKAQSFLEKYKKLKKPMKLRTAYLHLTQRCNFSCTYCYNSHNLNIGRHEISTEQWKTVINRLKSAGVKSFIFTGGEVCLREDLLELIKYTKDEKTTTEVITNGSMIREFGNEMLKYLDVLSISLDSLDPKKNAITRKNSEKYDLLGALRSIDEKYRGKVCIKTVVTRQNQDEITEMQAILKSDYGYSLSTAIFLPNSLGEVKLVPKGVFQETQDECLKQPLSSKLIKCGACTQVIAIDCDGSIYPCQALIQKKLRIGSILDNNWFRKLSNSPITQRFMAINVLHIPKCRKCYLKFQCGGGCRSIAMSLYGKLDSHPKAMCSTLKEWAIAGIKNVKFSS